MSGTIAGGRKAAKTNKKKYGKGFYAKIGRIGGTNGRTGGFAANPELARKAGAKGGKVSRRGASSITIAKIEPNRDRIIRLYKLGYSIPQIAASIGVSYSSLLKWAKENIDGYGIEWEKI